MTYVLDTNIITAILKDNEKIKRIARRKALEGKKIFINGISYYEIKRGLLAANATTKLTKFESLCKTLGLVLLDTRDIFDIASKVYANLKQRGELLKDADILIASTVIHKNFILVSADTDFNRIKGLKIENWLN